MYDTRSVSERFRELDTQFCADLGPAAIQHVMTDIYNDDLSLRQVADRNNLNMGDVVQIARYHNVDPVTLEEAK